MSLVYEGKPSPESLMLQQWCLQIQKDIELRVKTLVEENLSKIVAEEITKFAFRIHDTVSIMRDDPRRLVITIHKDGTF
jgi:hypothetical protein